MAELREIRRARPLESERLTEIALAAKRHWGYDERLIELWTDELTVSARFVESHLVFCAVEGTEVVGFYALSGDGPDYELEHMWVDPPSIGSGVGARLFGHAVATVAALGGLALRIAADPNAEGFYRKMGAVPAGRAASRPEGRTLPVLELAIDPSR